jgi:DNA-directed RNA polymerase subunit RPC12/RpoP
MATRNTIEFECPRCLTAVRAGADDSGKRIDCPSCQLSLLVPTQTNKQDLFDDLFESQQPKPDTVDRDVVDANQTTAKKSKKDSTPNRVNRSQSTEPVETVTPEPKNDPLFSDAENQTETPAIPLDPKDPFEVDHEAPLKIDGISDQISYDSVFGIKCSVCDTHIHVTPEQIGSNIECPECFTTLLVKRPQASKKKANSRWRQHQPEKSQIRPGDELALSDPVERPKIDYNIDPSFGLEEVTDDLLTPRQSAEDLEEQPETKQVDSATKHVDPAPFTGAHIKPKKSRRERLEAAQQKQLEKEKSKPGFAANAGAAAQTGQGSKDSTQFPDFDLGSLVIAIKDMFGSPGLLWRAIVSWLLMGVGWAMMHEFTKSYRNAVETDQLSPGDRALNFFSWFVLGGLPFIAGTLLLWFICGYIFRNAASGDRRVDSWGVSGTSELSSTFLIFSFSFLIGGLPVLFLPLLITPFRFLVAPALLLAAWFNSSPFAIVSVDAFQTIKDDASQWKSFYVFILILVVLSLVAGVLLMIPVFLLSWIFSLAGMAMFIPLTIAFAAVTGWHCGRIVQSLEKQV